MGRKVQGNTAIGIDPAVEMTISPLVPDNLTLSLSSFWGLKRKWHLGSLLFSAFSLSLFSGMQPYSPSFQRLSLRCLH